MDIATYKNDVWGQEVLRGVSWDLLNNYGQQAHFKRAYPTCASDHLPVLVRIRAGE